MKVPFLPMSPILIDQLPIGEEWRYQLKWDGLRIIAIKDSREITLLSKNMHNYNDTFPELVSYLQQTVSKDCIIDGEVVVVDPQKQRPNFHALLKRLRIKNKVRLEQYAQTLPITYALFDILSLNGQDVRRSAFQERNQLLRDLFPIPSQICIVTDTFTDGQALWNWVIENDWEGVVSKRSISRYHEGKKHNDWYKTKVIRAYEVQFVGYMMNDGRLASLLMSMDEVYCGKVSAGLDERTRIFLRDLPAGKDKPPLIIPQPLTRQDLYWFKVPLHGVVTSIEITDQGILRQPKIEKIVGVK